MAENKISAQNINLFYDQKQALFDIDLDFKKNTVTSLIGASGCGKSSLMSLLQRFYDP